MDIYPFKTIYIADLNAIQSLNNASICHSRIIEEINITFPNLKLWIDAGINSAEKIEKWKNLQVQLVLGSESFSTIEHYEATTTTLNAPYTLSLDFLAQGYKGPTALMQDANYWPTDIIAMTLAKVGSNTGVDIKMIESIMAKAKGHFIYAAGGIRHLDDLLQLKSLGAKGCLLASALHNKQVSTKDLTNLIS